MVVGGQQGIAAFMINNIFVTGPEKIGLICTYIRIEIHALTHRNKAIDVKCY